MTAGSLSAYLASLSMSEAMTVCTLTSGCSSGRAPRSTSSVPRWNASGNPWGVGMMGREIKPGRRQYLVLSCRCQAANPQQAHTHLDDALHQVLLCDSVLAAHNLLHDARQDLHRVGQSFFHPKVQTSPCFTYVSCYRPSFLNPTVPEYRSKSRPSSCER